MANDLDKMDIYDRLCAISNATIGCEMVARKHYCEALKYIARLRREAEEHAGEAGVRGGTREFSQLRCFGCGRTRERGCDDDCMASGSNEVKYLEIAEPDWGPCEEIDKRRDAWNAETKRLYRQIYEARKAAGVDLGHDLANWICKERDNLQRKLAESREGYAVRGVEIDRLNTELNKRKGDPVTRLHNICEGIAEDADGSEWSREEWERIDKENLELRNKLKQFAAWVLRRGHPPSETDGACSQCYPGGDILIEGFVCVYHEAVTLCVREFADTKHCVKCGWEPKS